MESYARGEETQATITVENKKCGQPNIKRWGKPALSQKCRDAKISTEVVN